MQQIAYISEVLNYKSSHWPVGIQSYIESTIFLGVSHEARALQKYGKAKKHRASSHWTLSGNGPKGRAPANLPSLFWKIYLLRPETHRKKPQSALTNSMRQHLQSILWSYWGEMVFLNVSRCELFAYVPPSSKDSSEMLLFKEVSLSTMNPVISSYFAIHA